MGQGVQPKSTVIYKELLLQNEEALPRDYITNAVCSAAARPSPRNKNIIRWIRRQRMPDCCRALVSQRVASFDKHIKGPGDRSCGRAIAAVLPEIDLFTERSHRTMGQRLGDFFLVWRRQRAIFDSDGRCWMHHQPPCMLHPVPHISVRFSLPSIWNLGLTSPMEDGTGPASTVNAPAASPLLYTFTVGYRVTTSFCPEAGPLSTLQLQRTSTTHSTHSNRLHSVDVASIDITSGSSPARQDEPRRDP